MIANTPPAPYYAVIFTSLKKEAHKGYQEMALQMIDLVSQQDGFLGFESVSGEVGITISYWKDLESILKWKSNSRHKMAQDKGKTEWYAAYKVRISRVEHDYEFDLSIHEKH